MNQFCACLRAVLAQFGSIVVININKNLFGIMTGVILSVARVRQRNLRSLRLWFAKHSCWHIFEQLQTVPVHKYKHEKDN